MLSSETLSNIYDGVFYESRLLQRVLGCAYVYSNKLLQIGYILKYLKGIFNVSELFSSKSIRSQHTLSLPPENIRKAQGFLMFLGGRERVHWERMN